MLMSFYFFAFAIVCIEYYVGPMPTLSAKPQSSDCLSSKFHKKFKSERTILTLSFMFSLQITEADFKKAKIWSNTREWRQSCGKRDQKQADTDRHQPSNCHRNAALVTLNSDHAERRHVPQIMCVSVSVDLCVC